MKELMNAYSAAQTDFHSRMAQRLLEILAAYMPSLRYHNTFTSLVNSTPNSAVAPNQLLPSGLPPLPTVEFEDPSSYQNLSKLLTITEKEVNTLRAKIATCLKDYIDENGGIKNGTTYIWSICKDAKET